MSNCVEHLQYLFLLVFLPASIEEHGSLDLYGFTDGVVAGCFDGEVVGRILFAATLQYYSMKNSRWQVGLPTYVKAGEMQCQPILVLLGAHPVQKLLHE